MEEAAQKAMAAFAEGNAETAQQILGSLDSPPVQFALQRTRELGNEAFRAGNYSLALQHYRDAIVALKQLMPSPEKAKTAQQQQNTWREQLQQLHSNCSACYAALSNYEEALRAARDCIKLNPKWTKGWYRAGKALYVKEDFEGALKTFMHAQRLQPGDKELASWTEKSKEQLQRQRRCMRFSVDYSRFQDVDLGDDDEALEAAASAAVGGIGGNVLEFSPKLSEEQRHHIEALLTGSGAGSVSKRTSNLSKLLHFDPAKNAAEPPQDFSVVYEQLSAAPASPEKKQQRLAAQAGVAFSKYLQMGTDLRESQRCRKSANCPLSKAFRSSVMRAIRHTLRRGANSTNRTNSSSNSSCSTSSCKKSNGLSVDHQDTVSNGHHHVDLEQKRQKEHCLFLGVGDCVTLLEVAQLNAEEQRRSGEAHIPLSLTAVPLYSSPALMATYASLLRARKASEAIRFLPLSPYLVQLQQRQQQEMEQEQLQQQQQEGRQQQLQGPAETVTCSELTETADSAAATAEKLEHSYTSSSKSSRKQMPLIVQQPFDCLVMDPLLFEVGVLGRQLIPLARHARTLCIPQPLVVPSSIKIWIQAFEVRLPAIKPLNALPDIVKGKGQEGVAAGQSNRFDLSPLEAGARWTAHVEPVALQLCPSEAEEAAMATATAETGSDASSACTYGDICTPRTKAKAVLFLRFDGPLENLDKDLPLHQSTKVFLESNSHPGIVNSFAVWMEFFERQAEPTEEMSGCDESHSPEKLFFSTAHHEAGQHSSFNAASAAEGRHYGIRHVKQGLFWVPTVWVGANEGLTVQVAHSPTKLSLRILEVLGGPRGSVAIPANRPSPACEQRAAVLSYQLDIARDPVLTRLLQEALLQQVQGQILSFEKSVKRKLLLQRAKTSNCGPHGGSPEGPQQQLAKAVRASLPISILCGGCCVLLPLLSLEAAVYAFQSSSEMRDVRDCGALMPIRVFAAEPLSGAYAITQKLLAVNAENTFSHPRQKNTQPAGEALGGWRPVKELSESIKTAAATLHKQQTQSVEVPPKESKATGASLQHRAKLKDTTKVIQTSIFSLLPPEDAEDSTALLAIAEAHRMKPGEDIKQQLQVALQQQDHIGGTPGALSRLEHPATLLASLGLDNAGVGGGIYALSKYVSRALLRRRNSSMLLSGVRVMAALLQLGVQPEGDNAATETAAARVWHAAAAAATAEEGTYYEVSLDEEDFLLLSDPVNIWSANCSPETLASLKNRGCRKADDPVIFKAQRSGIINALGIWFEFDMGRYTVSTQPLSMRKILEQQQQQQEPGGAVTGDATAGSRATVHYTQAWKQAMVYFPPQPVSRGETIPVSLQATETKLKAFLSPCNKAKEQNETTENKEYENRMHSLWKSLREAHREASEAWVQLLYSPTDSAATTAASRPQPAQIVATVTELGCWAGEQRSFFLDPGDAADVLRALFF